MVAIGGLGTGVLAVAVAGRSGDGCLDKGIRNLLNIRIGDVATVLVVALALACGLGIGALALGLAVATTVPELSLLHKRQGLVLLRLVETDLDIGILAFIPRNVTGASII